GRVRSWHPILPSNRRLETPLPSGGGAGGAQDVHIYLHKGGGFMREFKFSLGDETRRQGVKLTEV
ncbi:MAG: hypothetical protein ACLT09_00725, partial [Flavonifractor plautii]